MKEVVLTRRNSSDQGTFGILTVWKLKFFTGELPWRSNDPYISCIPAGLYKCTFEFSKRFGRDTYLLNGVPGRNEIRIHPANYMGDKKKEFFCELDGCISLGNVLGKTGQQTAIFKSKEAVGSFEQYMGGEDFMLEITNGTAGKKMNDDSTSRF